MKNLSTFNSSGQASLNTTQTDYASVVLDTDGYYLVIGQAEVANNTSGTMLVKMIIRNTTTGEGNSYQTRMGASNTSFARAGFQNVAIFYVNAGDSLAVQMLSSASGGTVLGSTIRTISLL